MYDVVTPSALQTTQKTYCAIHGYVVYTKSFVTRSNGATVTRIVLVDPVSSSSSSPAKTPEELARTATSFVTMKAFPALDRITGHNVQLTPVKKEPRGTFDSTPNPYVLKPGNGYAINVKFTDTALATKSKNVRKIEKVAQIPYCPHFTDIADCVNDTCVNVAAILDGPVEEHEYGIAACVYDASGCQARLVINNNTREEGGGGDEKRNMMRSLREAKEEGTVIILLDFMFSSGFDDSLAADSEFRRVLKPFGCSAMYLGTSSDAVRNRLAGAQRPSRLVTDGETLQSVLGTPDEEERDRRLGRMFGTLTDFLKKTERRSGGKETVLANLTCASSGGGGDAFVKSRQQQQQPLTFLEEGEADASANNNDHELLRYDVVTGVDLGFLEGETAVYWSSSAVENVLGMPATTFAETKKSREDRLEVMEDAFSMRRAVVTVWKKDDANLIVVKAFLLPRSTNLLPHPSDDEDDLIIRKKYKRTRFSGSREGSPDAIADHPF